MQMPNTEDVIHKAHKEKKVGKKVLKREKKVQRYNPKAFTFSGGVHSVRRRAQRALDLQTKREIARLLPNKTDESDSPPFIVVVHGPPKSGKSTLIKSLVKHYTKHNLSHVTGTITVTSGRSKRLTFVEASNNLSDMLDLGKVADLVLLTINAYLGFEMETFEFINILQVHGLPRIIGVLTHLDSFKDSQSIRRTKKTLKNRFWTELYEGAKLFYLSGLQYGRYNKTEIRNLCRFISVQKIPILSFRSERPYLLVLRYEDHTPPENSDASSRLLHFYGYLRGKCLKETSTVHIPGAGDYTIRSVDSYFDPCPLPEPKSSNKIDSNKQLRTLKMRQRQIYAPLCNVGNVQYEEDAVYIQLPEHQIGFTKSEDIESESSDSDTGSVASHSSGYSSTSAKSTGSSSDFSEQAKNLLPSTETLPESVKLVRHLQESKELLSKRVENLSLHVLPHTKVEGNLKSSNNLVTAKSGNNFDSTELNKNNNINIICEEPLQLEEIIYSKNIISSLNQKQLFEFPDTETSKILTQTAVLLQHDEIKNGSIYNEVVQTSNLLGNIPDQFIHYANTHEGGSFNKDNEFCDSGHTADILNYNFLKKCMLQRHSFEEDSVEKRSIEQELDERAEQEKFAKEQNETNMLKSIQNDFTQQRQKAQQQLNIEKQKFQETHRLLKEQIQPVVGSYVKITIENLPNEWIQHTQAFHKHIIIGGILNGEDDDCKFVQVRVKKHRWAPRILKSNDPLFISLGWRRFQTLPLFCMEDRNNARIKMLKYTPEHCHCLMIIFSPFSAPGTGVVGIRSWTSKDYRISLSGNLLNTSTSYKVMKKLKLVGEPQQILKNTAFIRKMFNSDLEVSKCIGAKIQTVSGIRGQIKKAFGTDGVFRATFEDKIVLSDIILCKTWIQLEPQRFYNPVLDVSKWRRLRTHAETRNDAQTLFIGSKKSEYGSKIMKTSKKFMPVLIPQSLKKSLPFKSILKNARAHESNDKSLKPTLTDYEKRVATMFNQLHFMQRDQELQKKSLMEKKKKLEIMQPKKNTLERLKRYLKQEKLHKIQRKRLRLS